MVVIAIATYSYQHYKTEKDLRMTKQEIKEEHRQQEGDPMVKGHRRRLARLEHEVLGGDLAHRQRAGPGLRGAGAPHLGERPGRPVDGEHVTHDHFAEGWSDRLLLLHFEARHGQEMREVTTRADGIDEAAKPGFREFHDRSMSEDSTFMRTAAGSADHHRRTGASH